MPSCELSRICGDMLTKIDNVSTKRKRGVGFLTLKHPCDEADGIAFTDIPVALVGEVLLDTIGLFERSP